MGDSVTSLYYRILKRFVKQPRMAQSHASKATGQVLNSIKDLSNYIGSDW
jgi:hypothetical protein